MAGVWPRRLAGCKGYMPNEKGSPFSTVQMGDAINDSVQKIAGSTQVCIVNTAHMGRIRRFVVRMQYVNVNSVVYDSEICICWMKKYNLEICNVLFNFQTTPSDAFSRSCVVLRRSIGNERRSLPETEKLLYYLLKLSHRIQNV